MEKHCKHLPRNRTFFQNLLQYIDQSLCESDKIKVVDFKFYDDLKALFPVEIPKYGLQDDLLLKLCQDICKYSVTSRHERFYNQLFGKSEYSSLGGAMLTEYLNTSAYTYEVAPVVLLLELETFKYVGNLFNFSQVEGIFCPGGSASIMNALSLSRSARFPESREKGMKALPNVRIYTSKSSHYSIKKGAIFMGFGTDCMTNIECDEYGRMIPEQLEAAILSDVQQNVVPLFVNATAGTTVYGAFDPMDEVGYICNKYAVWFHVDGCLGASVIFSSTHKHLMKGVEKADSLSWNPHKMLGVNLQCSMLITRHLGLMKKAHGTAASYLFQCDKFYDTSLDTGDNSLQCGRKVDVIKMWLSWQALGEFGLEEYVDKKIDLAKYLAKQISANPHFILIVQPTITNVCFYYIPKSLREISKDALFWSKMHKVAVILKERMTMAGTIMVGYNAQENQANFWRMVTSQIDNDYSDMDFILEEFDRLGSDIVVQ